MISPSFMTRSARVSPMLASSNNGSMAPRSAASLTPLLLTAKYSCCAGLEWAFAQATRPRVQEARLAHRVFLGFMGRVHQPRRVEGGAGKEFASGVKRGSYSSL